jgi:hypothetical protein
MRRLALVAAGLLVLAAAAYYGLIVYPSHKFRVALDQDIARLPAGVTATYTTASYSLLTHKAAIRDLSVKADRPCACDVSIGEIEIGRPNLGLSDAWSHDQQNAANLSPDESLPVADSISARSVSGHAGAIMFANDLIAIDKLRLYPQSFLGPGLPSAADALGAVSIQTYGSPSSLLPLLPLMRLEAAAALGVAYDSYAVKGLQASGSVQTVPGAAGKFEVSVASFQSAGFDRGVYKGGVMNNLVEKIDPQITATVDHITFAGMDISKPMRKLISADALTPDLLDGLTMERIEYDGFTAIMPQGAPVTIGSFFLSDVSFARGLPASITFGMNGVRVTRAMAANPRGQAGFDLLGIDTMTISLGAGFSIDADKGTAALRNASFKIDELGALTLDADLSGLSTDGLTAGDFNAVEAGLSLDHASLRYDDASLVDRWMRNAGGKGQGDPAILRRQFAAMAQARLAVFGDGPDVAASGKAASDFLMNPHSLTITAAPPSPARFDVLSTLSQMSPPQIQALLGLSVSANQQP